MLLVFGIALVIAGIVLLAVTQIVLWKKIKKFNEKWEDEQNESPNCRCIVPNNVSRCTYCGYDFMSGSAKTLTIEEAYKFKTYDYDYNCDNYADEFYAYDDYYNCENYKTENASAYRRETDDNSPIMLISALMLLVATLLLLSVVAIII